MSPADREEFLQLFLAASDHISIPRTLRVCRDPDDDKVIETAIVGRADCLLTADGDLLVLRPVGETGIVTKLDDSLYRGVAILKPAEFLTLVAAP